MNKLKFGSYIKESRLRKNYTQQELADLLFVDVTTVSKWERGVTYPDITLVPNICKVLEISEHELIESCQDSEYRAMKKDAKKYNNMKRGTFWTLNICYLLAILTCFIVNVSVSHTLSWFFIVLASIVCSYTFCPTITWIFNKYKKHVFILSTFLSMSLLFLTCSIYTANNWFMIAILGVLLGYYIVFYPILFKDFKKSLNEDKYKKISRFYLFGYVLGMVIITTLLLLSIYFYVSYNLVLALMIMGVCFIIPVLFGVINIFEWGKKLNMPLLYTCIGIVVVLFIIGISRAFYLKNSEETKIYNINEEYDDIKIDADILDINIHLSNNENKIVYTENKKIKIETNIVDGVLTINQKDDRKFYDKLFDFSDLEMDLYLTKDLINCLNIENSTGDIEIDKGITFYDVNIVNSTGDVEFKSNVSNNLKIVNSTGDVNIENIIVLGNSEIKTSTGDIELINVKSNNLDLKVATGDIELSKVISINELKINGSTGDVELDEVDASDIYIEVDTGDVEGTISSSKIFIARSNTGYIDVPETTIGGICKIITSTGNIKIRYK